MNCEEARARWHERLDGGGEDAGLEEHLESCASCREYAGQMDRLAGVLDELKVETESVVSRPVGLSADERVKAPQRMNWVFARRFMRIAAAVVVLVGGAFFIIPVTRRRWAPGHLPVRLSRLIPGSVFRCGRRRLSGSWPWRSRPPSPMCNCTGCIRR